MKKYDAIVIGAGHAGLSCAALMAQKGQNVLLLESHSDIGGCAGRFARKAFVYDAGATTLSGLAHQGPLAQLVKDLELAPLLYPVDPSLIILSPTGRQMRRYRKRERWVAELNEHFPHIAHKNAWEKIERINQQAWQLLPELKSFPPQNLRQAFSLISPKTLKGLALLPLLNSSFAQLLGPEAQRDAEFMAIINEMLLISTQSRAHEVNALIGSLGASYLSDTWVPHGGMAALGDQILEKFFQFNGTLLTKSRVTHIEKDGQLWKVRTHKEQEFTSGKLISTLPMWNHKTLGPDEIKPQIERHEKAHPQSWGAITAYTGIRFKKTPPASYFQVHSPDIPYSEGASVFISLSHPDDNLRAPTGQHALTASVHTHEKHWPYPRPTQEYKDQKKNLDKAFQKVIQRTFSEYGPELLGKLEVGTPHTFERYTGRFKGRVGGLPHKQLETLWRYPSSLTNLKGFYRLGDTVFPGQGVVGVVSGAQKLVQHLEENGEL